MERLGDARVPRVEQEHVQPIENPFSQLGLKPIEVAFDLRWYMQSVGHARYFAFSSSRVTKSPRASSSRETRMRSSSSGVSSSGSRDRKSTRLNSSHGYISY